MDKQTQIEEMQLVMLNTFYPRYSNTKMVKANNDTEFLKQATALYNAGYRKGETISYQAMVDAQNADRWEQGYNQGVIDIIKWLKRHGYNTEVKYLAEVYEVEVE